MARSETGDKASVNIPTARSVPTLGYRLSVHRLVKMGARFSTNAFAAVGQQPNHSASPKVRFPRTETRRLARGSDRNGARAGTSGGGWEGPQRVGTEHLPCVADLPDGFQFQMFTIASTAVSTSSRPVSPWGAGRLFGRRLGLGLGRHLRASPHQGVEQPGDHRRAQDRKPRTDPNGHRGDPDSPSRQIVHCVLSPVVLTRRDLARMA
jgi:hypothetical protein